MKRGCGWKIPGAHDRPVKPDRSQVIRDARHFGDILLAGGTPLAGDKIDCLYAASVRGEIGGFPIEVQIEFRLAGAHRIKARGTGHILQNRLRWNFDDLRLSIDTCTVFSIDSSKLSQKGSAHRSLSRFPAWLISSVQAERRSEICR